MSKPKTEPKQESPFATQQPQQRLNLPFGLHEPMEVTMLGLPPEPFLLTTKLGLQETLGGLLTISVGDLIRLCTDAELYRAPFYARHWTSSIAFQLIARRNSCWLYYAGRDWLDWMPVVDVITALAQTKDALFILLAYQTYSEQRVKALVCALSQVGLVVKETSDGPKVYPLPDGEAASDVK